MRTSTTSRPAAKQAKSSSRIVANSARASSSCPRFRASTVFVPCSVNETRVARRSVGWASRVTKPVSTSPSTSPVIDPCCRMPADVVPPARRKRGHPELHIVAVGRPQPEVGSLVVLLANTLRSPLDRQALAEASPDAGRTSRPASRGASTCSGGGSSPSSERTRVRTTVRKLRHLDGGRFDHSVFEAGRNCLYARPTRARTCRAGGATRLFPRRYAVPRRP